MAMHDCPGKCGRRVGDNEFACTSCWKRLPWRMRRKISHSYRHGDTTTHVGSTVDAASWFATNGSYGPVGTSDGGCSSYGGASYSGYDGGSSGGGDCGGGGSF